ncbi:gamma-glutamyltransferase family protein [Lichenihabitans psoromatis]|uniref:gamma-glutamyltransferase family protein n=1 Tax=Lichenihabitans psoromatis TaxID=2528642 RepID=UPI0010359850|nr:gamma-glutamyltransferase family protein [Lichenihabitans psoromatis]
MIETPVFSHAATAAPHQLAADAGRDVLIEGGNAIEATVAMASVIAVVYPHMNGLGGDGFWTIGEPGRATAEPMVRAIEACGYAGAKATLKSYDDRGYDRLPSRGPDAALTVPGAVDGWRAALELSASRGGKMPLSRLLEPAIRFARDGYPVSRSEAFYEPMELASLRDAPGFLDTFCVDGKVPAAGDIRRVPALAATLERLAHVGLGDFYRGDIAREMAFDLDRISAPVTREDLRLYEAKWRKPLSLRLPHSPAMPAARLFNTPPPTQGLAALVILGLFARLGVKRGESFEHMHGLIEASKLALLIRDRVCTDFDHLRENPDDYLTAGYLDQLAARIDMRRASSPVLPPSDGGTVWIGAIGADGLAVSYIQSVYWDYGSGCVLPRTGVLMQNRGLSFSLDPKALNALRPGRRPFHTLNPPLALYDDGRVMSYGAMGGDGQPQFQAQVFTRVGFGQGLADAIDAPRFLFGRTWGDAHQSLRLESRFDPDVLLALERAGHDLVIDSAYSDRLGHAGALIRTPRGRIDAAHDPRSDGGSAGF